MHIAERIIGTTIKGKEGRTESSNGKWAGEDERGKQRVIITPSGAFIQTADALALSLSFFLFEKISTTVSAFHFNLLRSQVVLHFRDDLAEGKKSSIGIVRSFWEGRVFSCDIWDLFDAYDGNYVLSIRKKHKNCEYRMKTTKRKQFLTHL